MNKNDVRVASDFFNVILKCIEDAKKYNETYCIVEIGDALTNSIQYEYVKNIIKNNDMNFTQITVEDKSYYKVMW